MNQRRPLDDFEETIVANVRDHGCHINFVAGTKDEPPIFGYSVGFPETVDQPEIIIFGLSSELTAWMINETLRQCCTGLELHDGAQVEGLLEGHICVARTVCDEFIVPDYLNSAIWYHHYRTGEKLDRVVQLVWPGADDGLFPWDPGCKPNVSYWQPALYEQGVPS